MQNGMESAAFAAPIMIIDIPYIRSVCDPLKASLLLHLMRLHTLHNLCLYIFHTLAWYAIRFSACRMTMHALCVFYVLCLSSYKSS